MCVSPTGAVYQSQPWAPTCAAGTMPRACGTRTEEASWRLAGTAATCWGSTEAETLVGEVWNFCQGALMPSAQDYRYFPCLGLMACLPSSHTNPLHGGGA